MFLSATFNLAFPTRSSLAAVVPLPLPLRGTNVWGAG